jgi:hypothetical protein
MHSRSALLVTLMMLLPGPLLAQAKKPAKPAAAPVQKVIPPKTVYWMSAATTTGFGMTGRAPSAGDMMAMAMGGGMSGKPAKTLSLDLGSKLPPAGPPAAQTAIPPTMNMGPVLLLKTPKPEKAQPYQPDKEPEDFERPKGKILLFWGCGETARPGQPLVIDFAKMAAGQVPPNLFAGERVRIAYPPSASKWPTWGGWPNDDKPSQKGIPANASLLGAHKVTGNYTPEIDFTLSQDWLAPLTMTETKTAAGAAMLGWNSVPAATSYFAQMMGAAEGSEEEGSTMVFWSSSELQTFMSGLSDYIAPAEAARLVGKKQLMPPTQTSCAIPKEAVAAVEGGMISLVAHGPEQNFIHPPRPTDPNVPWVQEWAVKARYAARTGSIAGMGGSGMGGNSSGESSASTGATTKSGKPKCPPDYNANAGAAIGGAVAGSLGSAVGGLFGSKKKKPVDCEQ